MVAIMMQELREDVVDIMDVIEEVVLSSGGTIFAIG